MRPGSEGWWNHTLAGHLHMTVGRMLAEMSVDEYEDWKAFYAVSPFDDKARFHVPAAVIAASNGAKFDQALAVMRPRADDAQQYEGHSAGAAEMFRAFGHVPPKRG
jgi:hypothetical protein